MRKYIPTKRLVELGKVLQYDTGLQELGLSPILTIEQRILINQERGRIMSGDFDYIQPVNGKIESVLVEIRKQHWKPETEIQYD
jgi:hypothetical protein